MGYSAARALTRRLALSLLAATMATAALGACSEDRVTVAGEFGTARFTVALADDNAERAQGLMFVEEMGTFEGMLFVYETPRRATFWMRNTLIPLDMLFAGPDGTIRSIHAEAVPLDETTIDGGEGIQFVLEINGGLAARLGIAPGAVLQHPAIGPEAALPCS